MAIKFGGWGRLASMIDEAMPTLEGLRNSDARIFETAVNLLNDLRNVRSSQDLYDIGDYVFRVLGHILDGERLACVFHEAAGDDSFMDKWQGVTTLYRELRWLLGQLYMTYGE